MARSKSRRAALAQKWAAKWIRIIIVVTGLMLLVGAGGVAIGVALVRSEEKIMIPVPSAVQLEPRPYTLPLEYAQLVIRYCDEQGVPVWLACRLFDWESGWNVNYVSKENENGSHDFGLAALNSACLLFFECYNDGAKVDPFDPETAIRVGVRYLAALQGETGSFRAAVGCYNVGLAGWRAGKRPARHMKAVMGEVR